jgi:hypothetical protein
MRRLLVWYDDTGGLPKKPETVTLETSGGVRLVVTRLIGLEGWYMHVFGLNCKEISLESSSLEDAKVEAKAKLVFVLEQTLAALRSVK